MHMPSADDHYIHEILRLEPLLRAFLHRFAPKPADLDDLVQETYARLLALNSDARMAINSIQAFALTTARHIAVDSTRKRKTIPFDLVEDLDAVYVSQEGNSVEQLVNAHQELVKLAQAVASLPERCAEVFTLRKVYGLTQQEIAAHFGISISTVEAHLVKAVKRCKAHTERLTDVEEQTNPEKSRRLWAWKGKQG